MEKKLATARMFAWILGILLVVALVVIWNDSRTISDLKNPARNNITAQQDIIREDCSANDPDSRARCADDLQHLSDLLNSFAKQKNGTTTSVSGAVNNLQIEQLPVKK